MELDNVSWLNPNILTFFPSNVVLSPTFNVFCTPFTVTVAVSVSSVIDVSFDIAFAISAISSQEYSIESSFVVISSTLLSLLTLFIYTITFILLYFVTSDNPVIV